MLHLHMQLLLNLVSCNNIWLSVYCQKCTYVLECSPHQKTQVKKNDYLTIITEQTHICLYELLQQELYNLCTERLKREEQCRLEQEKWKRKMENEAVDAQDQLSDLGMVLADLRGSLAQKEKDITTLQGRWESRKQGTNNRLS